MKEVGAKIPTSLGGGDASEASEGVAHTPSRRRGGYRPQDAVNHRGRRRIFSLLLQQEQTRDPELLPVL